MKRTTQAPDSTVAARPARTPARLDRRMVATVLAGDGPSPIRSSRREGQLHGSRLRLSGELESDESARPRRSGTRADSHGIDGVDVADLKGRK